MLIPSKSFTFAAVLRKGLFTKFPRVLTTYNFIIIVTMTQSLHSFILRAMLLMGLFATALGETWATTYRLQKVTSVSAGKRYVFEQGGYVMKNYVASDALQCRKKDNYKREGLTGTEEYVWILTSSKNHFRIRSNESNKEITNSSSSTISLTGTGSLWDFNFQDDGTCIIQNYANENRFLGFTSPTSDEYRAYATSNLSSSYYPHAINVYELVEVKTLNASGYATYCSENALDFTGYEEVDYSAWQITGIRGTTITFTQITTKVPKGTGMLLKGTPNATIAFSSAMQTTALNDNLLEGFAVEKEVADGEYFGLKGNEFVPVHAGTVPAGKALLPASSVPNEVKAFTFRFIDPTTGIAQTQEVGAEEAAAIFNLAGQRLGKVRRGVNIIDGRKVLIQ